MVTLFIRLVAIGSGTFTTTTLWGAKHIPSSPIMLLIEAEEYMNMPLRKVESIF
jgi:hypothetical protein